MRRRQRSATPPLLTARNAAAPARPRPRRRVLHTAGLIHAFLLSFILLGTEANFGRVDAQGADTPPPAPASVPLAPGAGTAVPDPPTPPPEGKHGRKAEKAAKTAAASAGETKEDKKGLKTELKEDRKAEDQFFDAQDIVPYFSFDFDPEEWDYIHKDARRYAECTMTVGSDPQTWKGVAVKLKGSAGSFQGPDAKPGLSISMNKYRGAERWHGILKWHLNNGAQDNSFLNEQMSCEIARMSGVPASRCAHAIVKWQKRDLGLFVFKEAFDKDFLAKFFRNPTGDLYDGGFVQDINLNMAKDQGDRERKDNLKELIAACQEGDDKKRWERVEKLVDINDFLSFTAVEALACHWDGYNFKANNYRLYFDADTGKAIFFLHGTDQTFGDANFPITQDPSSMVGRAVMSNPGWKQAYHERVAKIYNDVLKPIDWPARVVEVGEKVKAALALKDPNWAKDYENRIHEAHDRVASRIAGVAKQLGDQPQPLAFDQIGVAKLSGDWKHEGAAAAIDATTTDGKPCLHIRADGISTGAWWKTLSVPPGKYRLVGRVRTTGVVPVPSTIGEGAGLRLCGAARIGLNAASGDTPWKDVSYQFNAPNGNITLVAELRATKGEAWFERDSFRLERVP